MARRWASSSDSDSHVDDAHSAGASDRPLAARPAVIASVAGDGSMAADSSDMAGNRIVVTVTDRLDRDAVSRILARAQELEAAAPEDEPGIEPEALVEAATEVGIDPNAVRDSMAIERFTVTSPDDRRLDRVSGPAAIVIERELPLTVSATLDGVEAWLTSVHRLVCDRRSSSSLHARRRTDASARLGRTVAGWRGDGRLAGVNALDVEAVPQVVGSTPARPRTLLRIRADRHDARTVRLVGGSTVGLAGVGAGAVTAAAEVAPAAPVVALPLLVGGYVIARTGRGQADRSALELERMITLVASGERPTGLLTRAVRRVKRTG